MARRRPPARSSAEASAELAPHASSARAEELSKERARLLREVQKKQRQLEEVRARTRQLADEAVARMEPLLLRQRRLAEELERLFEELLSGPGLTARARRQLSRLRRALELQGVLEPRYDDEDGEGGEDEESPPFQHDWHHPGRDGAHGERRGPGAAPPEVAGARQVGQQRRSLRDIFRSLARAVHPDQARQEDERVRRTEVMKQVTRAYEDGDLARLIELETAWQGERALSDGGDPELRCQELSRLNRELLAQLRDVTRDLRDAKRDLLEAEEAHPADEVLALAQLELDDLEGVCELLRRFREGRVSVSDLVDGPLPPRRKRRRA
jgi:hypothetical protein